MEVVEPTRTHESHGQPEESGPLLFFGSTETTSGRTAGGVILSTGAAVSLETWRSGFDASWSTAS